MKHKRAAGFFTAILLLSLCIQVCAAPSAARREDGTVYNLDAAKLAELHDTQESRNILVTSEGITLEPTATEGSYVSLPIDMPEFSKISLTWNCYYTTRDAQPAVFVSLYRPDEARWSDWTLIPDGKTAGREKGEAVRALIRYRVDLSRAAASGEAMLFENLLVSGGERFFTESNLVLVLIMVSALVIYLHRKKKYGANVFRRNNRPSA